MEKIKQIFHLEFLVSLLIYTPIVAKYINVHLNHNLPLLYCVSNRATREFFSQINAVHDNIRFTMELELMAACPSLMFVELCKSGVGIRTCRKPMHTGLYGNWSSFVPLHYKNILLANSYGSVHEDSQCIKTMLMCNGFPANFLDDYVRSFLHRLYSH